MPLTEINFDGIVGQSHNYAGLSLGNLASSRHGGQTSRPRAAALEGLDQMRAHLSLGVTHGLLLPHDRPEEHCLAQLGYLGAADAQADTVTERKGAVWGKSVFVREELG